MRVQHLFIFIIFLSVGNLAWACDESRAKLVKKNTLEGDGLQLLVCSGGIYTTPRKHQVIEFFQGLPNEQASRWAAIMTEGAIDNKQGLLQTLGQQSFEIPITNVLSDNLTVDLKQTGVLKKMMKAWNQNMKIQPEKRVDLFSEKVFNLHGQKNKDLIKSLSQSGRQCHQRHLAQQQFSGFQFKFTDDEDGAVQNILPIEMTRKSNNVYTIQFHTVGVLSSVSKLQTRDLKVNPNTGVMTWLGSPDGSKYFIAPQKSPKKSMQFMFGNTYGVGIRGGGPLCNAESSIEKIQETVYSREEKHKARIAD